MSELEQGNESGVSPESSVSSETASPVQSQETAPEQEAQATVVKEPPLNEHPRFKELIAQKNQEREERLRLEQRIKQMEANYQKQTQPAPQKSKQDQLLERLAGIDPDFAEFQKGIYEKLSVAEKTAARLQEMEEARQSEQAIGQFDKLCSENKVADKDKFLYQTMVANMANANNAKMSDLPHLFKEAHTQISKYFEERDRAQREAYVADKAKDKRPATQTGGIPASATAKKGNMSIEDAKAELVKQLRSRQNI